MRNCYKNRNNDLAGSKSFVRETIAQYLQVVHFRGRFRHGRVIFEGDFDVGESFLREISTWARHFLGRFRHGRDIFEGDFDVAETFSREILTWPRHFRGRFRHDRNIFEGDFD